MLANTGPERRARNQYNTFNAERKIWTGDKPFRRSMYASAQYEPKPQRPGWAFGPFRLADDRSFEWACDHNNSPRFPDIWFDHDMFIFHRKTKKAYRTPAASWLLHDQLYDLI